MPRVCLELLRLRLAAPFSGERQTMRKRSPYCVAAHFTTYVRSSTPRLLPYFRILRSRLFIPGWTSEGERVEIWRRSQFRRSRPNGLHLETRAGANHRQVQVQVRDRLELCWFTVTVRPSSHLTVLLRVMTASYSISGRSKMTASSPLPGAPRIVILLHLNGARPETNVHCSSSSLHHRLLLYVMWNYHWIVQQSARRTKALSPNQYQEIPFLSSLVRV